MARKKLAYDLKVKTADKPIAAPKLPYQPRNPKKYNPNIALIACGGITHTHLTAYKAAGYNVVAFCDCDLSKAEARRKEFYPDAMVTTDHRDILRRDDIEVLDIAAHPRERLPILREAILAKKHILSQKPFVLNLADGARLVDLAHKHNVKLAINQNGRFAPHWSYLRHAIAANLIGRVISANLSVHWDHNWIANTPFDKIHHVVLYDFAVHWFDILTTFMTSRTPTRVFASVTKSPKQKAKPPLLAQVLVEYPDAQATLSFTADTPVGHEDRTYIAGTEGSLKSVGPGLQEQRITLYTRRGIATPELQGSWFPGGFHGAMAELLCAIEERRQPSNSAASNLPSLALCFAAIASAQSGKPQIPGKVKKVAI
jgi:predicted dehydrogenase